MRQALPLREGREIEARRRLERQGIGALPLRIEMLQSRVSLEPGIFGIARPVLLWLQGISQHLEDTHLEAILAHELSHVRRRDNLAAALHMLVEAIFWFHLVVWWLGARLVEERERACDEEVLRLGKQPQVYAESILKVCEFCVGSPLACVSGVTGADLKKRIVRIMTERVTHQLDFSKKLLLGIAGLLAVAAPIAFGVAHASPRQAAAQTQDPSSTSPAYEVASIKPNKSGENIIMMRSLPDGFTATGVTLHELIRAAYGVQNFQISGGPGWLESDKYDIQAEVDSSVAGELRKLGPDQSRLENQRMLQALLADRFRLSVHRETKELPVYKLVIAKNGSKLRQAKVGDTYPNGIKGPDGRGSAGMVRAGMGEVTGQGISLAALVRILSEQLGRTIVDKTGIDGNYDIELKWTPAAGSNQGPLFKGPEAGQPGGETNPVPETSGPSIFTAIQEQLGLKLESSKGPVETVVIDHAETPSGN